MSYSPIYEEARNVSSNERYFPGFYYGKLRLAAVGIIVATGLIAGTFVSRYNSVCLGISVA